MINKIVVFNGSKRDFETFINSRIDSSEKTINFLELIQIYNARLRPNESGVREQALSNHLNVKNCIVRSDDYGSVMPHVLSNFANVITLNYTIDYLFIQNPPKTVLNSLESRNFTQIEYQCSEYEKITREKLKTIYVDLKNNIKGQDESKKQIISGLYKLNYNENPSVIMLYGPSGVGKTETAKSISNSMGGKLMRTQFSMMQTSEAYDYIFGSEHSKNSFARDMLSRETDIVLIDEFDKVNPVFYNAFYELFDEGVFTDVNYNIKMSHTVFFLTSNFLSEKEIINTLGPAMFSRIGCCIKYDDIPVEMKREIVEKWYNELLANLKTDEVNIIKETNILNWFKENVARYNNIRLLKTKMENAIFEKLADVFVIRNIDHLP